MEWIAIIITAIVTLVLLWFIWKSHNVVETLKASQESRLDGNVLVCSSPTCARCQSRACDASSVKQKLIKSLTAYVRDHNHQLPRILCTIYSIDNKSEILRATYQESSYEIFESLESQPHIWWMPGLKRSAFWKPSSHGELERIAALFESSKTLNLLQLEYKNAYTKPKLWKENKIPSGKWRIFHLYDQGCRVNANSSICPHTLAIFNSISNLMTGCVYGNVMISVLGAESEIEHHTGPCNFRLRCHVALFESKHYKIKVGTEVRSWKKGKLMVFDDSFIHRVWHEGGGGDKERVVLIFDVWHPDVQQDERQSLKYLFPSDCPKT